jgi:hypothetical protein
VPARGRALDQARRVESPLGSSAIDLAIGERTGGPVFLTSDGQRLDRHVAGRIVRKASRSPSPDGQDRRTLPVTSGTNKL